jgi:UDP-glucose:(heptosyl)LPS alpha-1,3-glucosyltransferase
MVRTQLNFRGSRHFMRVALVNLHADPSLGGAERYTFDLAAALANRGLEVTQVSSTPGPDRNEVRSVVLPSDGLTRARRYLRWLSLVEAHLSRERYDIVHAALPVKRCDVYHPHAGLAAGALRMERRKRHGRVSRLALALMLLNRRRQVFARVERELLTGPRPPIVISLSDYVRQSVESYYPLPDDRHARLFNGVDLKYFKPARWAGAGEEIRRQFGIACGEPLALIIAQNFRLKGVGEAIAALAKSTSRDLKLIVVGGSRPGQWRKQAAAAGIADRVIFAGPTTQPGAFYAASDFFVLPTKGDSCSLVVLEAVAMGLPVVTTACNGAAELLKPGREGFVLADPRDVDGLASAMEILTRQDERGRMAAACRLLRDRLSHETHVDRLLEIYDRARPRRAAA